MGFQKRHQTTASTLVYAQSVLDRHNRRRALGSIRNPLSSRLSTCTQSMALRKPTAWIDSAEDGGRASGGGRSTTIRMRFKARDSGMTWAAWAVLERVLNFPCGGVDIRPAGYGLNSAARSSRKHTSFYPCEELSRRRELLLVIAGQGQHGHQIKANLQVDGSTFHVCSEGHHPDQRPSRFRILFICHSFLKITARHYDCDLHPRFLLD
ncbi:hypothetical protein R3P38DRAFT_1094357 [Favolaschia claudopus]|uniref:Uncharacterized protein n=1 Tax=Favolaschia claudopus TaxID=2862362 RepID=A0AAW0B9K9_9AGAR